MQKDFFEERSVWPEKLWFGQKLLLQQEFQLEQNLLLQ